MNGTLRMCPLALAAFAGLFALASAFGQKQFEEDVFQTSGGDLKIAFIGHGTLMLTYAGKIIHVDPVSLYANYETMPKADLILITHEHGDHLDLKALAAVGTARTVVVANAASAGRLPQIPQAKVMKNGDSGVFLDIPVEAVPAYNMEKAFHPKGRGNGYILTLGDKRVLIAGDTENVPEIKSLKNIDIAFLPMNQPYTMTPGQVADTARAMRPKVLYPYHYGDTDTRLLLDRMKDEKGIDVRIRNLK